jgi:hypothetical protein
VTRKGYFTSGTGSGVSYSTDGDGDTGTAENTVKGNGGRNKRNVSAFKIMTMTRGFTEEADRLLDYLVGLYMTTSSKLSNDGSFSGGWYF